VRTASSPAGAVVVAVLPAGSPVSCGSSLGLTSLASAGAAAEVGGSGRPCSVLGALVCGRRWQWMGRGIRRLD